MLSKFSETATRSCSISFDHEPILKSLKVVPIYITRFSRNHYFTRTGGIISLPTHSVNQTIGGILGTLMSILSSPSNLILTAPEVESLFSYVA